MNEQELDKNNFRGKVLKTASDPDNKTAATTSEANSEKGKTFSQKWEQSRFWLISGSFKVFRSIWMVVIAVGGFIAWLIAMLFI